MATLNLSLTVTVSKFVSSAIDPNGPRELALFGTRGDGKTISALVAMIAHANEHRQRGGSLPTIWMGATDTHESHKRKTIRSLSHPIWMGCWHISDQGHDAKFRLPGQPALVKIDLFGLNDAKSMDKVRAEAHGLWFEEPAPAGGDVLSTGVSEDTWTMALTSLRLPTYRHPAIMTLNYPDEDHWTWQRFVADPLPGTAYWRIPPGERATPQQRAEWSEAMANQPDLRRRLLDGEPGHVQLGPSVAVGYNPITHVAKGPLKIIHDDIWMGHDSAPGAHHHATVVGQRDGRRVLIHAALVSADTGWHQHLEQTVLPWLDKRAPWCGNGDGERLLHRYDPAMATDEGGDIDHNPLKRGRRALGGTWGPGPVKWMARAGPMLAVFNAAEAGIPLLQIDPGPDTAMLRKALGGRWYYKTLPNGTVSRDLPFKPNHPWEDLGDAFCYLIGGMAPSRDASRNRRPVRFTSNFDIYGYERRRQTEADTVPLIGADMP